MHKELIEKITSKRVQVGIVGMGYVGLPLALRFLQVGIDVTGFDVDPEKVSMLKEGKSYIEHISAEPIQAGMDSGKFHPTTDFSAASAVDVLMLCVPTPLDKHREPDLSYVVSSLNSLLDHLQKGQMLILESTTYPCTTEEVIAPEVEKKGFTIGKDFFCVYSPEREDPGNPDFETRTIPKVVGGLTAECGEAGVALYEQIIDQVVPVTSTRVAEMTKILENTFRAVNIALVNELKLVAEGMGVDIFEVIRAASTKPFGYMPFYPGPGLGGHCIPIDPFYLTWKAREYGLSARFIELAGEVNTAMPDYVITVINNALNTREKSLKGSRILILGVAYKKNVDDMRESPSLNIIQKLEEKGAQVDYSDPHVPMLPAVRKFQFDKNSVALTPDSIREYDCIVVSTDHDAFDLDMIRENSDVIVDPRGVYTPDGQKIFRA